MDGTVFKNGFSNANFEHIKFVLPVARELSGYRGKLIISCGENDDLFAEDTNAWVTWSLFSLWSVPNVKLFPRVFDDGIDEVGITLTHELIHCRQGFWRVYGQKFLWMVLRREGEPPVEEEAYESVNMWYDHKERVRIR